MLKQNTGRIHSMDAVRAIAMLLGIVLHASIAYRLTPAYPWPVDDAIHSIYYNYLYLFIHSFRMQLFFLVAGFFARFLYLKIGARAFIWHRIRRILIPFIAGLIVIAPLSMLPFFYYQYAILHPGSSFWQSLSAVTPNLLQWNGMVHLWFLYYLAIFYIGMLLTILLFRRLGLVKVMGYLYERLARIFKTYTLVLLIVPVFLMTCLFQQLPIEPYTGFKPDIPLLLYYGFFFCVGYFIHFYYVQQLESLSKHALLYFVLGLIITPFIGHLDRLQSVHQSRELFIGIRALFSIQTVMLVIGFLGLFIRYLNTESYTIRYISDASYWMYLIHVPLITWTQIALIGSPVPPIFRFWLVNVMGILVPLVTYAWFVRYTMIGKLLNGPRKKRETGGLSFKRFSFYGVKG